MAFDERAAHVVVVTGGRRWAGRAEAAVMAEALCRRGVPRAAIVPEYCSLSTKDNARYTSVLLAQRGVTLVGLVTCDWHMPRALRAFERYGVACIPLPAASPRASVLRRATRAARELASAALDRLTA